LWPKWRPDRATSVRNGLALLGDADLVLIHDAAGPVSTPHVIDGVIDALATHAAAPRRVACPRRALGPEDGAVQARRNRTALMPRKPPKAFDAAKSAPLMRVPGVRRR